MGATPPGDGDEPTFCGLDGRAWQSTKGRALRPKPAEGRAQARTCDPARSRTHDRAAPTRCAVVMPPNAAIILSTLLLVKRSFYFSAELRTTSRVRDAVTRARAIPTRASTRTLDSSRVQNERIRMDRRPRRACVPRSGAFERGSPPFDFARLLLPGDACSREKLHR